MKKKKVVDDDPLAIPDFLNRKKWTSAQHKANDEAWAKVTEKKRVENEALATAKEQEKEKFRVTKDGEVPKAKSEGVEKKTKRVLKKKDYAGRFIEVLIAENPYRKDSTNFIQYELLKTSRTVEGFLSQGGKGSNVSWAIKKRLIKLNDSPIDKSKGKVK